MRDARLPGAERKADSSGNKEAFSFFLKQISFLLVLKISRITEKPYVQHL